VYVALLDFDGLLCDMDPFSYELEDHAAPGRWGRFFGHTSEATPVQAGVELVATLQRLGWRYSVSSTRPPWNAHAVRQWVWSNMPVRPVAFYVDRPGKLSTAECKRRHYVEAVAAPRTPVCALVVDDDQAAVDELIDLDVPVMHIDELAGLSDDELSEVLTYSVKGVDQRRREYRADKRRAAAQKLDMDS